jgi:hypothetical protein
MLKMDSEKELYKIIDEILWKEWDPIGVNETPEARNEYYGYIPDIFSLTLKNTSADEIADKLDFFATDRMGLTSNKNNCIVVAKKIISEKNKLIS